MWRFRSRTKRSPGWSHQGKWATRPFFFDARPVNESERRVKELIGPAVQALGYDLLGVEHHVSHKRSLLRVYIDSESGIGVNDCERVSYQVGGILDVEDPIAGAYDLEVSSPGADRPLFEPDHFARHRGARVKIRLSLPIDGRRNFRGILEGCRDGKIFIKVDGLDHVLPLSRVGTARLVPDH